MADESTHEGRRKLYLESVKAWAEAELSDEAGFRPMPMPFLDPFCHEILGRLYEVEEAVGRSRQCPLAPEARGEPNFLELLVGPAGAKGNATKADGLREIRDFTRGAERLTVVDPYAYGGEGADKADAYVKEFAKTARIDGAHLKNLHIIYSSKHGKTKDIIEGIAHRAANANVTLTDCDTDGFHDRLWIADRKRGLVVGTSFGGLGKRAAFLLELPEFDLKHVLDFIDENDLMKGSVRRPRLSAVRKRKKNNR